jgi:hypothetical protein
MELFQATHESKIQNLYDSQRQEYREFVLKVYDELLEREVNLSDSKVSNMKSLEAKTLNHANDIKLLQPKLGPEPNASNKTVSNFPMAKLESRQASRNRSHSSSNNNISSSQQHLTDVDGSRDVLKAAVNKLSRSPSAEILSIQNDNTGLEVSSNSPVDVKFQNISLFDIVTYILLLLERNG